MKIDADLRRLAKESFDKFRTDLKAIEGIADPQAVNNFTNIIDNVLNENATEDVQMESFVSFCF